MPAAEASQCVEATIPNVPASCGLVVNESSFAELAPRRGGEGGSSPLG